MLRDDIEQAVVLALVEGAFLGTVNLAEVLTKVLEVRLIEDDAVDGILAMLQPPVLPKANRAYVKPIPSIQR